MDRNGPFWYRPARRGSNASPRGVGVFGASRPSGVPGPVAFLFQKEGIPLVQIVVRDNNVEQALRALKKKMQREGTFREMKRRKFYEKPSEKKARQKAEAVRRARKLIRKRMQREGAV